MAAPRVAFIDIETAPILGYSWGPLHETSIVHVLEPTYILCYAIKWQGEKKITTHALPDYPGYSKNKKSDKALCADLWKDLDRADIVAAHNGVAFDEKKIKARLIVNGYPPPSPFKSIDTLKIARQFKFDSNKLDNIGRYLNCGSKLVHTGMDMWIGCMDRDDPKSWRAMRRYNSRDIDLLCNVYEKLKMWDKSHPSMTAYDDAPGCPTCRSTNVQRRGIDTSKVRKRQRMHCQGCGKWFLGETIKKGAL
jgi:uncharacterized protein YprB with RNaseH-like and TPR domain